MGIFPESAAKMSTYAGFLSRQSILLRADVLIKHFIYNQGYLIDKLENKNNDAFF